MLAMFAAEFEPAILPNRRRSARMPADRGRSPGEGGLARALCKVMHLSKHGARVQTYSALQRGSTIWLTLPGLGPVAAVVMWADDFRASCQFLAPLLPAQYKALVALH